LCVVFVRRQIRAHALLAQPATPAKADTIHAFRRIRPWFLRATAHTNLAVKQNVLPMLWLPACVVMTRRLPTRLLLKVLLSDLRPRQQPLR